MVPRKIVRIGLGMTVEQDAAESWKLGSKSFQRLAESSGVEIQREFTLVSAKPAKIQRANEASCGWASFLNMTDEAMIPAKLLGVLALKVADDNGKRTLVTIHMGSYDAKDCDRVIPEMGGKVGIETPRHQAEAGIVSHRNVGGDGL